VEFLIASNLENLNRGNEPTFCSGQRLEVLDITTGSFGLLENIISWEVSSEPSLSCYRHVLFTIRGSIPTRLIRNHRGTNWCSFQEDLRDVLGRGRLMNIRNQAGLGLAIALGSTHPNHSSINDLPRSARLHRALSRDPKVRRGSLVTPSGRRMQSEGETLNLLLHMHFPNSVAMEKGVATAGRAK